MKLPFSVLKLCVYVIAKFIENTTVVQQKRHKKSTTSGSTTSSSGNQSCTPLSMPLYGNYISQMSFSSLKYSVSCTIHFFLCFLDVNNQESGAAVDVTANNPTVPMHVNGISLIELYEFSMMFVYPSLPLSYCSLSSP